jgi:hypothetical protein
MQAMHVVSTVCPAAAVEYLPAMQAIHVSLLVWPAVEVEYLPVAHSAHAFASVFAEY